MSTEDWKPDGWDDWTPNRRTLWRREAQLARMRQLSEDPERDPERLAPLIEHLEREIAQLRDSDGPADSN